MILPFGYCLPAVHAYLHGYVLTVGFCGSAFCVAGCHIFFVYTCRSLLDSRLFHLRSLRLCLPHHTPALLVGCCLLPTVTFCGYVPALLRFTLRVWLRTHYRWFTGYTTHARFATVYTLVLRWLPVYVGCRTTVVTVTHLHYGSPHCRLDCGYATAFTVYARFVTGYTVYPARSATFYGSGLVTVYGYPHAFLLCRGLRFGCTRLLPHTPFTFLRLALRSACRFYTLHYRFLVATHALPFTVTTFPLPAQFLRWFTVRSVWFTVTRSSVRCGWITFAVRTHTVCLRTVGLYDFYAHTCRYLRCRLPATHTRYALVHARSGTVCARVRLLHWVRAVTVLLRGSRYYVTAFAVEFCRCTFLPRLRWVAFVPRLVTGLVHFAHTHRFTVLRVAHGYARFAHTCLPPRLLFTCGCLHLPAARTVTTTPRFAVTHTGSQLRFCFRYVAVYSLLPLHAHVCVATPPHTAVCVWLLPLPAVTLPFTAVTHTGSYGLPRLQLPHTVAVTVVTYYTPHALRVTLRFTTRSRTGYRSCDLHVCGSHRGYVLRYSYVYWLVLRLHVRWVPFCRLVHVYYGCLFGLPFDFARVHHVLRLLLPLPDFVATHTCVWMPRLPAFAVYPDSAALHGFWLVGLHTDYGWVTTTTRFRLPRRSCLPTHHTGSAGWLPVHCIGSYTHARSTLPVVPHLPGCGYTLRLDYTFWRTLRFGYTLRLPHCYVYHTVRCGCSATFYHLHIPPTYLRSTAFATVIAGLVLRVWLVLRSHFFITVPRSCLGWLPVTAVVTRFGLRTTTVHHVHRLVTTFGLPSHTGSGYRFVPLRFTAVIHMVRYTYRGYVTTVVRLPATQFCRLPF